MTRTLKVVLGVISLLVVVIVAVGAVVLWPVFFPDKAELSAPGGSAPGSVVEASAFTDLPVPMRLVRAKGARIKYMSTGTDGKPTVVSGTVFVPGGEAPAGGWPVIALGHGTLGINTECGPSLSPNLLGLVELAQGFVGAKYAVTVADYQGLGAPGVHEYLDSPTAGRNVIDSVRALRTVFGESTTVSNRWVGYGSSQGGGAIWAANEENATYSPELDLLGTVEASPPANVVGLVAKARAGTITTDQAPALQWVIESAARAHPDIVRDDYRSGTTRSNWDILSACMGPLVAQRDEAVKALGPFDLAPKTDAADARLTALLTSYALPQRRASAPMYVLWGTADTYIDAAWTQEAVRKACAMGDVIEASEQPGKGHSDVDNTSAVGWLKDRFDGKPAPSNC
ncbi:lipase family protein [Williamsia maris]|uniref:Secretory lipase n=1 Tax=Williamsia maris TaxID=72806 RepID=A0ABT1HFX2_9NOCA|nr:lipase family protein [Williamsia maris]MCP2177079.1 Secretory lipase [Williamsia maris]